MSESAPAPSSLPSPPDRSRASAWARISATVLGFIAGYADATGYLRWHVFGANMTGNTVIFVLTLFEHGKDVMTPLVPIVAFLCGALIAGVFLLSAKPAVPLLLEAALIVAAAFSHGFVLQLGFLALAMGMQNNAVSRFDGVRANTSFITGDYTQLAKALAGLALGRASADERRTVSIVAPLIFCYAFGACVAAVCGRYTDLSLLLTVPLVLGLAYVARRGALA